MINRKIGLVFLFALFGLAIGAFAHDGHDHGATHDHGTAQNPGASPGGSGQPDAVYLEVIKEYTLNEDGSMVQRHEHKLRYDTFYAVSRILGETFIVYNPEVQELDIQRVVTTMADGTEVDITPNAKNVVLPGYCANAPQYMHLREMVVTHLGLERGAVAHLIYEIRTKAGHMPFLMGEEVFSSRHPIEKKTVKIKVPSGANLQFATINSIEGAETTEEGGYTCHTWTMKNLPGVPQERMSQSDYDYAPRVVFSTCPSWKDAAMLLSRNIDRACWLDEKGTQKAKEMKDESTDVMDFVRKVNKFVAEEVASAGVPMDMMGYVPNKAEDTFRHNVGCRLDKLVLLVAMLRSQGYFAQPVFFSKGRTIAEKVPAWSQFDECRVICTLRSKLHDPLIFENLLFLDPNRMVSGIYEDGLAGRTVFRPSLLNNQLQEVPLLTPEQNRVRAVINLTLDEEWKLSGEMSLDVSGSMNPNITLGNDYESWAKRSLAGLVAGSSVDDVKPVLISENKSMFRGKLKDAVAIDEEHGLYIFNAQVCPGGISDMHVPVALESRVNPMWLPRAITEQVQLSIKLPDNARVISLPPQVVINNKIGKMNCNAWVDDGVLYLSRNITLNQQLIPQGEYAELRELMVEWEADDASRIVFGKNDES